jgi:hypothetical protein
LDRNGKRETEEEGTYQAWNHPEINPQCIAQTHSAGSLRLSVLEQFMVDCCLDLAALKVEASKL